MRQRDHLDASVDRPGAGHVTPPRDDRDVVIRVQPLQSRQQMLAMGFDTACDAGNAAQADHANPKRSFGLQPHRVSSFRHDFEGPALLDPRLSGRRMRVHRRLDETKVTSFLDESHRRGRIIIHQRAPD